MQTRYRYGNCPLGLWYLILRGLVTEVGYIRVPDPRALAPYHLIGFTRQGHVLHFQTDNTCPANFVWFRGRFRLHTGPRAETYRRMAVRRVPLPKKWQTLGYLGFLLGFVVCSVCVGVVARVWQMGCRMLCRFRNGSNTA